MQPVRHPLPVPALLRIDGHGADGEVTGLARVRVGFHAKLRPQGVLAALRVVTRLSAAQVHADVALSQILRDGVVHPFHPVPGVTSGMAGADAVFRVALGVAGPKLPAELTNLAQAGSFLRDDPHPPGPTPGAAR